jgi:uncharacterized caspase-like protein
VTVVLGSGKNQIDLTAIDHLGRHSLTQELFVQNEAKAPRTLYFLAIGLSRYSDLAQTLGFGAKDAEDLGALLRERAQSPGAKQAFDQVVVLDALTNERATAEKIHQAREAFSPATVNDTVILFFAGHGMTDGRLDFYLAPYDMVFSAPQQHGISIKEMESILGSSHSRRRLLLIDACHSGELDKAGNLFLADTAPSSTGVRGQPGPVQFVSDDRAVNAFELLRSVFVDLRENTGTQIISASRGEEDAGEDSFLKNGFFTRAVIEGLTNNAADTNGDDHVSVSELLEFVARRVQELSHRKQTPTQRQANLENDFRVQ